MVFDHTQEYASTKPEKLCNKQVTVSYTCGITKLTDCCLGINRERTIPEPDEYYYML